MANIDENNPFKSLSGLYVYYARETINDEWEMKIVDSFDPKADFDNNLRSEFTGHVPVSLVKDGKVDIDTLRKIFPKPI